MRIGYDIVSRGHGYFLVVYMKHFTQSCGVSYVPHWVKVVDVLAVRLVKLKRRTEIPRFRTGLTLVLHLCQNVHMQAS